MIHENQLGQHVVLSYYNAVLHFPKHLRTSLSSIKITSRARAEMPTISRDSLELARIHLMQHASIKSVWHYNSGVCYHLVDEE